MSVYLGIDLGTTGLKALLVREDGSICASGYGRYAISTPAPGYAEQNPKDWWRALKEALAQARSACPVSPEEIGGIGLSGQMHGTVLVGHDDALLSPAIIWCDQRSAAQVERIRDTLGTRRLGQWTQNPIAAGFQAATLLWMQENEPTLYRRIARVLLPKDYIRFLLTGQYGTEPTDACSTLLFDCAKRAWSGEMLDRLQISRAILPDVLSSPMEVHAGLCAAAARELDLRVGIPVVCGGGDQPMQAIGNGVLNPGDACITLGTGGQIFVPISQPAYDEKLRVHMFCHAPQDTWYVMGAILNCCLAQNWLLEKVLHMDDPAAAHAEAAAVKPGSEGLYFLPYLSGERTPYMDASLTGAFSGLTLRHDRAHIIRAAVEGITYALRDAMDCIQPCAAPISRLILTGGGARSVLWKQIMADVMNRPVYTTDMVEAAGMGAAICAMVGTGAYASLEEACGQIVRRNDQVVLPDAQNVPLYREHFDMYQRVSQAHRSMSHAAMQR